MARRRGGLDWRGDDVKAKVARAATAAINETLAECVSYAKANHSVLGWVNRTGNAEGSIQVTQVAAREGARIVGRWGSIGVDYFLALEYLHGHTLVHTADVSYRDLRERIKRRLR